MVPNISPVDFFFQVKQPEPDSPGQSLKGSYVIQGITDEWQRFRIPLNMMSGIETWKDLDVLVIGFHSRREKVTQGSVFIDDITFVKTGDPGPSIRDPVSAPKKLAWEEARGGEIASSRSSFSALQDGPPLCSRTNPRFRRMIENFCGVSRATPGPGLIRSVTGSTGYPSTRCVSAPIQSVQRKAAPAIT